MSIDTKEKINVLESAMAQINISVEDNSHQHHIQPADGIPTKRPKRRIDTAPARPNSSLSELESMDLGKEHKPRALIIGDQSIEVKDWTELSIKFVEWLIEKNYLSKNNLPIYTFSKRDKYFINYDQRHEIAEKNGAWKPVGDFFVDTKYNADGHKKNIICTLKHLRIDDADIKISFR